MSGPTVPQTRNRRRQRGGPRNPDPNTATDTHKHPNTLLGRLARAWHHKGLLIIKLIEPTSFLIAAALTLFLVWSQWSAGVNLLVWLPATWIFGEVLTAALSIYFAARWIRWNRRLLAAKTLTQVGDYTPQRCVPPQVVRWDFLGVLASNTFGKIASVPLPTFLRAPMYTLFAKAVGANLSEVKYPLSHFVNLQQFFTRPLVDGARPISDSLMVSPVDGKVVVLGPVLSDRVEQVKGVTYSLSQFLGKVTINAHVGDTDRPTLLSPKSSLLKQAGASDGLPDALPGLPRRRSSIALCSKEQADAAAMKRKSSQSPSPSPTLSDSNRKLPASSPVEPPSDTDDAPSPSPDSSPSMNGDSKRRFNFKRAKSGEMITIGEYSEGADSDSDSEFDSGRDTDTGDEASKPGLVEEDVTSSVNLHEAVLPGNKLFHCVIYLSPKDYHRIHTSAECSITHLRHFPGTLFPISPIVARLIPNLFALNERAVMSGEWKHGFYSLTAVGAYNVGSIRLNFDPEFNTNKFRRDFRNPNLELFSYRGVGCFAYDKPYDVPHDFEKAGELGCFMLGSTVVLVFEAPEDFEFLVQPGETVRMGQPLGRLRSSAATPNQAQSAPAASPNGKAKRK